MPQAATIKSLPRAFRMMKILQAQVSLTHDMTGLCNR